MCRRLQAHARSCGQSDADEDLERCNDALTCLSKSIRSESISAYANCRIAAGCGKDSKQRCLQQALTEVAGAAPEQSDFVDACEEKQSACPGLDCKRLADPRMASFAAPMWSALERCLVSSNCDEAKMCIASAVLANLTGTRACLGEVLVDAPAVPTEPERIEPGTIAGVRLGAPRSSIDDKLPIRYGGVHFATTYEFERNRLSRFMFQTDDGCAGVASALKRDFGQPSSVVATVAGGRDWEWRGKGFVLTLTENPESCYGTLEAK